MSRSRLLECLGGEWPAPAGLLELQVEAVETLPWGSRERLSYWTDEPRERVPAFLLLPAGASPDNPVPAVVICHQHNGQWHIGKSEPAGLTGDPMHHTGVALAQQGFAVLCADALGFEERERPAGTSGSTDEPLKGGNLERWEFLRYVVQGKSLAWKNIVDVKRSVDLLCARPEIAADKLGVYGHSMGSTHAWMAAPWEPRFVCAVGNCCLPTYAAIERARLIHCFPNFVPGWGRDGSDTPDIAALIAPRPLHLNFGDLDDGSPIEEVRQGIDLIARVYASHGGGGGASISSGFSAYIEEGSGHVLSPQMWQRTLEFFQRHLTGTTESARV